MVHVDLAALRSIEREKDISFDTLLDALETALLTAYKHTPHSMPHARVSIDRKSGEVVVWAQELGADGEIEADAHAAQRGVVLVDIGKVEAILPQSEQVPGEQYTHGLRIRCYVVGV